MSTPTSTPPSDHSIHSVLKETRTFAPPPEFSARARLGSLDDYRQLHQRAIDDPEHFWAEVARELTWSRPFTEVRRGDFPHCQWFVDGELNVSVNCLDRHLGTWRRNKAALIWQGEPLGDRRVLTYHELSVEVARAAHALRQLGVQKGDRVGLYLPMIPELAIAMLACARIGAIHSVVFAGFSAEALRDRLDDAGAVCLITADGGWRRGRFLPLRQAARAAFAEAKTVKHLVVVRRGTRSQGEVPPTEATLEAPGKNEHDWHDLVSGQPLECPPTPVPAEHPLFILYTSGTTGKPKGVVHSTGGYLVGATYTTKMVFDLRDEDTYFCTADVGWVTGHSYLVYGPLANGATAVMYEGAPDWPEPDRLWRIIDELGVTILYTAPTAIRAFMRWGEKWPARHSLASLRLLGSVGEPINPEAWMWYHRIIGKERCPIVDTWWQTETGSIMMSPLPGATPTKPGSCTLPLPGIQTEVVHRDGTPCKADEGGLLVIQTPWPSMLRTVWGDDARFVSTYFSQVPGAYFTGDGARRDPDGYFWVMGRVDDVLNVAGHRLGTAEVESAIVSHPSVAEAAVVGRPDPLKGQVVVAFVTLRGGRKPEANDAEMLKAHVVKEIGAIARPEEIRFTDALPKTRSGKIMRRLLKELAATGTVKGDVTTLEDMGVISKLAAQRQDEE
ncbi:MAG TPA: acetate--CoA ligase [Polyangia bacterium]|nr:acetate--CoA ligase [Polyangia bacterium]